MKHEWLLASPNHRLCHHSTAIVWCLCRSNAGLAVAGTCCVTHDPSILLFLSRTLPCPWAGLPTSFSVPNTQVIPMNCVL